jgi:EAL domain-containing protein (putative c-di-GMP-specific phosphodiesterase class I)
MKVAARDLGGSFDQGGLFLAYQPKMNASDGRILGLETIVRWLKPNGATMDAADFFPLAGRYGPIGRWVMLTAFSQLKRWRDDGGAEWSLSINTSSDSFARPLA